MSVSSIKPVVGQCFAASAAMQTVASCMAMSTETLPPTINYDTPDPVCDLDYVPNEARKGTVRLALSNSFGFGGQNICLAVRAFNEE